MIILIRCRVLQCSYEDHLYIMAEDMYVYADTERQKRTSEKIINNYNFYDTEISLLFW